MNALSIATFNTWNCQGALERRLPLMAAGLSELNADVILLQEVFAQVPRGLHVAQRLANALEMDFAFIPARKKLRPLSGVPVLCHSGLAVLVKGSVRENDLIVLPDDARDGERLGQWASVTTKNASVLVGNVHLSHLHDEDSLREKQLQTLLAHQETKRRHDLCVLGGDMNLKADHPIFQRLCEDHGFQPAPFQGTQSPASSLNPIDGKVPGPGVIDHIFVKADKMSLACVQARPALNEPDGQKGLYPSDHMAIVADIEVHDDA